MGTIKRIVLHCSDSKWGSAVEIDRWHRKRGWRKIGYMGVITNGYIMRYTSDAYWRFSDGAFEWGRPLDQDNEIESGEVEAHAFGINKESVGICLIGQHDFSVSQLLEARKLINHLRNKWGLSCQDVVGHYEVDSKKTCPNIDMDTFRRFLIDHRLIDDLFKKGVKK